MNVNVPNFNILSVSVLDVLTNIHTDRFTFDRFGTKFDSTILVWKAYTKFHICRSLRWGVIMFIHATHTYRLTYFRLKDLIQYLIEIYHFGIKAICQFSSFYLVAFLTYSCSHTRRKTDKQTSGWHIWSKIWYGTTNLV